MNSYSNDIPMGLGMALSKNLQALNYFSNLSQEQQQLVINRTHSIESRQEMQAYVSNLPKGGMDISV